MRVPKESAKDVMHMIWSMMAIFLLSASVSYTQVVTATLVGTVKDSSGAVIPTQCRGRGDQHGNRNSPPDDYKLFGRLSNCGIAARYLHGERQVPRIQRDALNRDPPGSEYGVPN